MSMETWGQVPKSQSENILIDEAIAAAIADHEADPEAHQGAGESLQNHKSDEVIDHPEASVVSDKIDPASIDVDKFNFGRFYADITWESLDWATVTLTGTASAGSYPPILRIKTGTTNGSSAEVKPSATYEQLDFIDRNPCFQANVRGSNLQVATAYVGMGIASTYFVGFKYYNAKLYACWVHNGTEYTEEIAGTTGLNNTRKLRAEYTTGVKIDFYIDDVIVYTATTNLPYAGLANALFYAKITSTSTYDAYFYIYRTIIYQDRIEV